MERTSFQKTGQGWQGVCRVLSSPGHKEEAWAGQQDRAGSEALQRGRLCGVCLRQGLWP